MSFKDWWQRKTDINKTLLVMHTDDMLRVHPQTDWTHNCEKCGGRVGIYPSGQQILKQFPDITIMCNRCQPSNARPKPAPGALAEPYHSRWRGLNDPPKK